MTETQKILDEMLKENTGIHMLDSGGAYGRHWSRNKDTVFDDVPQVHLKFNRWKANNGKWYQDLEMYFHVYHWLDNICDYHKGLDDMFYKWVEADDPGGNKTYMQGIEEFLKEKQELGVDDDECLRDVTGLYGDDNLTPVNTYNSGDGFLSQTLWYIYFELDSVPMIALCIHGGCDVRGGYTNPRIFELKEETAIYDFQRGGISCSNVHDIPQLDNTTRPACGLQWFTDDAYTWYQEDTSLKKLNDYEYRVEGDDKTEEEVDPAQRGKDGYIHIDSEGNGYCPNCGQKLEGWYY